MKHKLGKYIGLISVFFTLLLPGCDDISDSFGGTSTFTVRFVNYDNTILQEDLDVAPGIVPEYFGDTPTRSETPEFTYTFKGWSPAITFVTTNQTYTAQYTENLQHYDIRFENDDRSLLKLEEDVPYGPLPLYSGETPLKDSDVDKLYSFIGWEPAVSQVTGPMTYRALYEASVRTYLITWQDADGTLIETEEVPYGEMPIYQGEAPTKSASERYTYSFSNWSPMISEVTRDTLYTAVYTQTERTFTLTWQNADGTVLEVDENVSWEEMPSYDGSIPQKSSDSAAHYTFSGWSPTPSLV